MTQASISFTKLDGIEVCELKCGTSEARIVPEWGNNCVSLTWRGHSILEPVEWSVLRGKPTSFGIPILFPFPNRVANGRFEFSGKTYSLDPPRHGFVRSRPWVVTDSLAGGQEVWVTSIFESHLHQDIPVDSYPSSFSLEATYRLRSDCLILEYAARNTGQKYLPVGLGIHPYFQRPSKGTLKVPANLMWELEDSLPTGERVPVPRQLDLRKPRQLENLELDDIYTDLIGDRQGFVGCLLEDQEAGVRTTVRFSKDEFPEVVVYTVPEPREAICVEPYTCPTDALNLTNRDHASANLVVLPPSQGARWTIYIEMKQLP